MESVTLHEKWELVSMDNADLSMKSEIRYPWVMFIYKQPWNAILKKPRTSIYKHHIYKHHMVQI